jgi:hypothetical protein
MARLNAQVAGLHPSSHPGQEKDLETDIRIQISDISTPESHIQVVEENLRRNLQQNRKRLRQKTRPAGVT